MKIKTKVFGEVTIDDDKAIHFPAGIIGFPDMTEFALIHDEDGIREIPAADLIPGDIVCLEAGRQVPLNRITIRK